MNPALHPPLLEAPPARPVLPADLAEALARGGPQMPMAALHRRGPLHWWDEAFGGCWLLSSHAEVKAALRDPRLSVARVAGWGQLAARFGLLDPQAVTGPADSPRFQRLLARALLFVDDPDHRRLRPLMQAGFGPAALQALRPAIEARLQGLLAPLSTTQPFDFIEAVARPLPAGVIGRMLGVPEAQLPRFAAGAGDLADLLATLDPRPAQLRRAQRRLLILAGLFEPLIAARRAAPPPPAGAPAPDLLDRLLAGEAAGLLPHADELLAQAVMLLFAGHETTRHLLGSLLQTVLSTPGLWARLRAEPQAVPRVVREVLRLHSPVQYTVRRVAQGHERAGQWLARGQLVILLIGAANRDPARHAEPERFDPDRPAPGALAFGSGPHVCLGAALTLLEAETLLRELLQRWPELSLAEPAGPAPWLPSPLYRGLQRLMLRAGGGPPQALEPAPPAGEPPGPAQSP